MKKDSRTGRPKIDSPPWTWADCAQNAAADREIDRELVKSTEIAHNKEGLLRSQAAQFIQNRILEPFQTVEDLAGVYCEAGLIAGRFPAIS